MTAPKGHKGFVTKQSKKTENKWNNLIKYLVSLLGPEWELVGGLTLAELYGDPEGYLYTDKNGVPTTENPDPGFLFYKGVLVAVFEAKYQKARSNACERANKFLPLLILNGLDMRNFFVVFDGPAFSVDHKGHIPGQGGATWIKLKAIGCTTFNTNLEEEDKLEDKITEQFYELVKRVEEQYQDKKVA